MCVYIHYTYKFVYIYTLYTYIIYTHCVCVCVYTYIYDTFLRCGMHFTGFYGGSDGKESACNAGDPGSITGSGRSERQSTPVFLPGEFHGRKSLAGYSPWGCRVRHDWVTHTGAFYIWSTCQFGLATFQVLNSPMWPVATVLASRGLAHARHTWWRWRWVRRGRHVRSISTATSLKPGTQ